MIPAAFVGFFVEGGGGGEAGGGEFGAGGGLLQGGEVQVVGGVALDALGLLGEEQVAALVHGG